MWDRRMIGVPNQPRRNTVFIDLPRGWSADALAPRRRADVGSSLALTYVTVLSAAEAARLNAGFKRQAEETLRARLAEEGQGYVGQHLDESAVQGAAAVEALLEAIQQEGYFSSWVIVEECTID